MALALIGCAKPPGDDTGETDDGGGIDTGGPTPELVEVPTLCAEAETPGPRRYHQMALVDADRAIDLSNGRWSHRGIVVFGGMSPAGIPLDDLWYYDLTDSLDLTRCDWIKLADHASFATPAGPQRRPTWGGTLQFMQDSQALVLSGGYQAANNAIASSRDVWTAPPGGAAFQSTSEGLGVTASQVLLGDEACSKHEVTCLANQQFAGDSEPSCIPFEITYAVQGDPCLGTYTYDDTEHGPCETPASGERQTDYQPEAYKPACVTDPWCELDADDNGAPDGARRRVPTAPGRGFAAALYDPLDPLGERVELHGGTTGCSGPEGACGSWLGMLRVDGAPRLPDLAEPYYMSAADIVSVTPSGGVAYRSVDVTPWSGAWGCGEVRNAGASIGVHHGAAATIGLDWDAAARDYVAADIDDDGFADATRKYLIGGSVSQVVPPGRNRITGTIVRDYAPPSVCVDDVLPGFPVGTHEEDVACGNDTLDRAEVGSELTLVSASGYASLATNLPRGHSQAACQVSPTSFAVLGGVGGNTGGDARAFLVDATGHAVRLPDTYEPRFGAAAVWDPLYQRAFTFGGADTDVSLYEITASDSIDASRARDGGAFAMSNVEVVIRYDGGTASWTVDQQMDLTWTCDTNGDDCWAEDLQLEFETDNVVDELSGAAIPAVMLTQGGVTYELTEHLAPNRKSIRYALPRVVGPGEQVHLSLAGWERIAPATPSEGHVDALAATSGKAKPRGIHTFTFGEPLTTGWAFSGIPVWVMDRDATSGLPVEPAPVPISTVGVQAPPGLAIIGPGTPYFRGVHETGGRSVNTYSNTIPLHHRADLVVMLPGFEYVGASNTPALDVPVWVDTGMRETGGVRENVEDYVSSGALRADAEFLVERLGALPTASWPLVVTRPRFNGGGLTTEGMSFVFQLDRDGGPRDDRPWDESGTRRTAVHELAHAWFGVMRTHESGDPTTWWLLEGMPELLGFMRHDQPTTRGLKYALDEVEHLRGNGITTGIESRVDKDDFLYAMGAYTVAQHFQVAKGPNPDSHVWGLWRSFLASPPFGTPTTRDEVRAFVGERFYDDWVATGREGTPLLKIRYLQWDEDHDQSGGEDMTTPGSLDLLIVEQAQVDLYGWKPFCSVPFYTACVIDQSDPDARAFAICNGIRDSIDTPRWNGDFCAQNPDATDPAQPSLALDLLPARPNIASVGVALVSADLLVPEALSHSTAHPWRNELYCPADAPGLCAPDSDGDGWGYGTDCNDDDPAINPQATSDTPGLPDDDCDGWGLQ